MPRMVACRTGGGAILGKLARVFHEGGCVSRVFAKRINLMGRRLGVFVQGQFVPIRFQEKCAVTA
jgi:hypothetical protein